MIKLVGNIKEANDMGYASFNQGPHLCVDVPDGTFTITTRTSDGNKVTFSFVPYTTGGPAGCVDIRQADSKQRPIVFCGGVGRDPYHHLRDIKSEKDEPRLTTLVLKGT